jgi:hypothetical protein
MFSLDGISVLSGDYKLAPEKDADFEKYEMGWWSNSVPLQTGNFPQIDSYLHGERLYNETTFGSSVLYPYLSVYFLPRTVTEIRISFDNQRMEYAKDFDIYFYDIDGVELYSTQVIGNTGLKYNKSITAINEATQMLIIFKSWSIVSNIKIAEMLTSIQEVYNGKDLFNLTVNSGINKDQLSGGQCVVTLYNRFRKFDFNNTTSILYNQIRRGVRIYPQIGDGTDWIDLGEYFAEAWDIKRKDVRVTVTGIDKVGLLEKSSYTESKIIEKPDNQSLAIDDDSDWNSGSFTGLKVSGGLRLL